MSFAENKIILQGQITNIDDSPIAYVNIFLKENPSIGTTSNEDGKFHLPLEKNNQMLVFSHIYYKTKEIDIKNLNDSIQVILEKQYISLPEITAKSITTTSIMNEFYNNFDINHSVEPANYNVFTRIVSGTEHELEMIEEYYMNLHHTQSHNSTRELIKCRIKPYSKKAKKELEKSYRFINLSKMVSDNMQKYREDVLIKRNEKNFRFQLTGISSEDGRETYIIKYKSITDTTNNGVLHIDKENFGLSFGSFNQFENKNTDLIYFKNKWYLKRVSTQFTNLIGTTVNRVSLYNNTNPPLKKSLNKDFGVEKAKAYIGDINDDFWLNYTHIPLPKKYIKIN